ncbi:anion permease [Klebsiella variicola subsp. variicola]|nr:anion permease [Klebsiella variicola subsp. variicola]
MPYLLWFVPVPDGLPPYARHSLRHLRRGDRRVNYFEPLPGAVIGITGVVVIALCSQWLLFSPVQMAAPSFKLAGASL